MNNSLLSVLPLPEDRMFFLNRHFFVFYYFLAANCHQTVKATHKETQYIMEYVS